jgi:nitrite reductase/ring-hydroxylating ferredoxin subunit
MARHVIGRVGEVPPGQRKIVEVEGQSIGVFNVHGTFYALKNRCPHQGAPLCLGSLKGTALPGPPGEYHWAREGEILRCPWHGWEFDVTNGRSFWNPHRCRVRTYEVTVEPDDESSVETYRVTVEQDRIVLHV